MNEKYVSWDIAEMEAVQELLAGLGDGGAGIIGKVNEAIQLANDTKKALLAQASEVGANKTELTKLAQAIDEINNSHIAAIVVAVEELKKVNVTVLADVDDIKTVSDSNALGVAKIPTIEASVGTANGKANAAKAAVEEMSVKLEANITLTNEIQRTLDSTTDQLDTNVAAIEVFKTAIQSLTDRVAVLEQPKA